MSKRLYVGNLPYETTEEELRTLFADFGEVVSATIITDRESGRSKGFGFIELAEGGEAAIAELSGKEYEGRTLRVDEAKPPQQRR
ncbi:MAG: RNA-binding protein [Planctomycetota bacterium]|nr:MAG: RNA-binding protein [Planctomycetota bacterium]